MMMDGDARRHSFLVHHSEKLVYSRPELTSYERADLGYYSVSNANARCQANCAENTCTLIETCSVAPCHECDTTNECGTGMDPNLECFPWGC